MKKITSLLIMMLFSIIFVTGITVQSAGYTYTHDNRPIHSTEGYEFYQNLTFDALGLQVYEFAQPEDLYIYNQELIYIVDSKSNQLMVFTTNFDLITKKDTFIINKEEYKTYNNIKTDAEFLQIFSRIVTGKKTLKSNPTAGDSPYEFKGENPILTENIQNEYEYIFYGLSGVYRFEDNIYLADKGNHQIVVIDANTYRIKQIITTPEHSTFKWYDGTPAKGELHDKQALFQPTKLVVDRGGRIYAISDGIYEGIIEFSPNGQFNRFMGVNYTTLSAWEIFWRAISTDTQLSRRRVVIQTIFTSLSIDSKGFIYATSHATKNDSGAVTNDNAMIKLINTSSDDVLKRNGYVPPKGDLVYAVSHRDRSKVGPSEFSAITSTSYGTYTVADSKRGRLFTYDADGYLLYISGQFSTERNQLNKIEMPVSIKYLGEDLIVLDRVNKAILIFKPTPIAKLINEATYYYYIGEFEESSRVWNEVVKLNSLYEYAYVGIGKSLYKEGRYQEAMEYFELGFDRVNYSKAYKQYRDQRIRKFFGPVMTIIILAYVAKKGYHLYKYIKFGSKEGDEE